MKYRYTAGLQLTTDFAEYQVEIIAPTSDEAWNQAQEWYKNNYSFTPAELTTMVLFNERKIRTTNISEMTDIEINDEITFANNQIKTGYDTVATFKKRRKQLLRQLRKTA